MEWITVLWPPAVGRRRAGARSAHAVGPHRLFLQRREERPEARVIPDGLPIPVAGKKLRIEPSRPPRHLLAPVYGLLHVTQLPEQSRQQRAGREGQAAARTGQVD